MDAGSFYEQFLLIFGVLDLEVCSTKLLKFCFGQIFEEEHL